MQDPASQPRSDDPAALAEKVRFLSTPASYGAAPPDKVEVTETNMSFVFLVGDRVFKLKKPVRHPFLDFSTLDRRRQMVDCEVRLNRRLAPSIYLGARALRRLPEGALTLGDEGEVVDWLVEMRRLPDQATLTARIEAGTLTPEQVSGLADILARFYAGLPPAEITPETYVSHFEQENSKTAAVLLDPTLGLDGAPVNRALAGLEAALQAARPQLAARVAAGRVVEGHGDLRPGHVFLTDPPVIIDCIEFNLALRTVDPFDEIAQLAVDCAALGAGWVHGILLERLARGLDDRPPDAVLEFYWRYRALLRARLSLAHLAAPKVRTPEKWRPMARSYVELSLRPGITVPPA